MSDARIRKSIWAWLLMACLALPITVLAQDDEPVRRRSSKLKESVDVRMVQVVLSVIDRDVSEYASVRDIPLEDFVIKLNGKELTPQQKARTVIDPMCEKKMTPDVVQEALGREIPDRPMILMIDFNYLDALGRHNVARALRQAAETVEGSQIEYKVYGYTRDLAILTPTKGFVTDPAELRIAADRVEETIYTRLTGPGDSGFEISGDGVPEDAFAATELGEDPLSSSATSAGAGATNSDNPGLTEIRDQALENSLFEELGPESDFNPSASLGAIERIMVIHSTIPWMKTVVLFSSEAFGFADPQKEERAIYDLLAERKGYRFWPVISDGLADGIETGGGGPSSRILSSLAGNTGGHSTRRTANLFQAIEGATEQLSCYYLVSVPVSVTDDETEYKLTVQLDREGKDKETADRYFHYRLDWDRKKITFRDPGERLRELRMAALFSPDDFPTPPLTVTLDYPVPHVAINDELADEPSKDDSRSKRRRKKKRTNGPDAVADLNVRFRVRLADLDWNEVSDGLIRAKPEYAARFIPALVVEQHDSRGTSVLCEFDVDQEGYFRTREITVPLDGGMPNENDPLAISVGFSCPVEKMPEGLYVARGLITDVGSGRIAAGRSSVFLHERDEEEWKIFTPRMETVTNRELIWEAATRKKRWDRTLQEAWRTLAIDEIARVDDRLALRYVLCGPEGQDPAEHVGHVLFRESAEGPRLEYFLGKGLMEMGEGMAAGRRTFCPRAEVLIEPYTITETGNYFIATYETDAEIESLVESIENSTYEDLKKMAGLLAVVPFSVTRGESHPALPPASK